MDRPTSSLLLLLKLYNLSLLVRTNSQSFHPFVHLFDWCSFLYRKSRFLDGLMMNLAACCLLVYIMLGNQLLDSGEDNHVKQAFLNRVQFQFLVQNHVNIWKADMVYFVGIRLV
jgi:hypothetical protein